MPTPQPRWSYRFVNQAGQELAWTPLEAEGEGFTVFGRAGDIGGQPFSLVRESTPDGRTSAAAGIVTEPGRIIIPFGVEPPSGTQLWDYSDQIANILRPRHFSSTQMVPNSGYLYFTRSKQIATPDQWRIPVMPEKWAGWQESMRDSFVRYQTEVAFQTLADYWEQDPATVQVIRTAGAASWTSLTPSITPGGDAAVDPIWTIGGPATGTLNTITIQHPLTMRKIVLNNLGMTLSHTLVISTEFLRKYVEVNDISVARNLTQDSDYFTLNPDAQQVTITKDGASQSAVTLSYRRRRQGL